MGAEDTIKEALRPHDTYRYVPPFGTDIDQEHRHANGCKRCAAEALLDSHVLVPKETVEEILEHERNWDCLSRRGMGALASELRAALGGADT